MSLSGSGSISCSADHFPAYLIRSPTHINPFPPWWNKADAKSSLDGSVICPIITGQILKPPHEWRQESHPWRRKVVNIYTELLKFKFRYCVYNFINISTHETYVLCQEAIGFCRVPCPTFADSGIKKQRCLVSSTLLPLSIYTRVYIEWHQSANRVSYFIITIVWCKLMPFSIKYILLYIFKYLMKVIIFS